MRAATISSSSVGPVEEEEPEEHDPADDVWYRSP
jgi:hypothetical protein